MFLGISAKLWVALCVTLLACMGLSLPYPVLTPLFIDAPATALNSYGGYSGETLLTVLFAIYPLGIFIGSSFIGALSDRFRSPEGIKSNPNDLLFGYLVSAYALYIEDYFLLVTSRFLTGITEGNVAIARAIALDIGEESAKKATELELSLASNNIKNKSKENNGVESNSTENKSQHKPQVASEDSAKQLAKLSEEKTRAVSLINSAVFVGWLLGPLIGGALAQYGAHSAMFAAAVASILCVVLVKAVLIETNREMPEFKMSIWESAYKENSLRLVAQPWMRKLFFIYFFYALAMNLFYEFYPVWLVDTQSYDALGIGLATTNMTIFMTLTSIFLVTIVQLKFGLLRPMTRAILGLSLMLFLVPFTSGVSTLVIFSLTGILVATFNGLLPVYISENQSGKKNGAAMGLLTTTFCIANVFAAIFGGLLLQLSSHWPLFLSSMFYIVSLTLLYLFFVFPSRKKA
ncbi:MFS transporter [Psychrosphaera haliotis]|uniref:MFS transporter n=1 Tax=Psychrosphaera haliotis TaxID=555083 RepID=A0A6N8F9N9_9GAMM|nr:MFS transporter [Psychrosphaera haliotis]MUH72169.1 MFS transporter [Psychrosphaera haliotis]